MGVDVVLVFVVFECQMFVIWVFELFFGVLRMILVDFWVA